MPRCTTNRSWGSPQANYWKNYYQTQCFETNFKILVSDQQLRMGQREQHVVHSVSAAFKKTDLEAILLIEDKKLSLVSTKILFYETLRNYALLSLIPYVIHIVNQKFHYY